jgi:hypothetical protein
MRSELFVKISMDNDAIKIDPCYELSKIFGTLIGKVLDNNIYGNCMDTNGNRVGSWAIKQTE